MVQSFRESFCFERNQKGMVTIMENYEGYINVQDALKRVGGSMALYKRLLNSFVGGDNIDPIEKALNDGAMDDASRLVHTIKGVAANLSLEKLTAAAVDLEHKIKDGLDCSASFETLKQTYLDTSVHINELP